MRFFLACKLWNRYYNSIGVEDQRLARSGGTSDNCPKLHKTWQFWILIGTAVVLAAILVMKAWVCSQGGV